MDAPLWIARSEFEAARGQRPLAGRFEGLWAAGTLEGLRRPCVAVVGTRAASGYGKATARRFASELGAAGCCIISGLALGIDAAAHEGALESSAPTIGVLGGGHARFFPRRNRELADRMIAGGGAVLSPFPPEHPAHPPQFLQRNGVVAALADALVVIEAPARSGALNTASWAAGRIPVFAVPGDVDRPHVAGCHALIRDGATLARNAQDVLDELRIMALPIEVSKDRTNLAPRDTKIMDLLSAGETTLDELCEATGESAAEILAALSMLELLGLVEARAGLRYVSVGC